MQRCRRLRITFHQLSRFCWRVKGSGIWRLWPGSRVYKSSASTAARPPALAQDGHKDCYERRAL
eukprot:scaffold60004_cov64-Phaeocystis_antarctica.AAC.3